MRRTHRLVLAAVSLTVAASAAAAPAIFRCGNSYSQTPCADARAIEAPAPQTDAQRAEGRAVAAREKQLALEMVRERRERESALRPAVAGSLGPARSAAPPSPPAKKNDRRKKHVAAGGDERDFVAIVPKAAK